MISQKETAGNLRRGFVLSFRAVLSRRLDLG